MLCHRAALTFALTLTTATAAAPLTYREALTAALRHNPDIDAAALAVGTRQAQVWQAGLLPNPELRLEAENIGGSGDLAGVESAETTARLLQRVELGGKRPARVAVAEGERDTAAADVELRQAAVAASVAQAFVAVLAAQEQLHLADRLEALATETVAAVAAQARAGAASEVHVLRARLLRNEAVLLRLRRHQELTAARAALAALWADDDPPLTAAEGDLRHLAPPPPLPALLGRLDAAPELTRWQRELGARQSAVRAERAGAVPDLLLGAGPRYFSDTGDVALVAEVTLPLPVFDRRQGAIEAARSHLAAGEAERRAAAVALRAAVTRAQAALVAGYAQTAVLREHALPDADAALATSRAAFRRGALPLDELGDAQRALFDLRSREIEVLAAYHQTAAELERLLGRPPDDGEPTDPDALPGEVLR
ncbi:TolC family protein [bacterium]|nr:TolC family protein [bacterium]